MEVKTKAPMAVVLICEISIDQFLPTLGQKFIPNLGFRHININICIQQYAFFKICEYSHFMFVKSSINADITKYITAGFGAI